MKFKIHHSLYACSLHSLPILIKKTKNKKPKETGTAVWAPQRTGCMEAD